MVSYDRSLTKCPPQFVRLLRTTCSIRRRTFTAHLDFQFGVMDRHQTIGLHASSYIPRLGMVSCGQCRSITVSEKPCQKKARARRERLLIKFAESHFSAGEDHSWASR